MAKHRAHDARARGTHAGCLPPHAGNGIVDVVTKLARLLAGPGFIKLKETPTTPISSNRDGVPKST